MEISREVLENSKSADIVYAAKRALRVRPFSVAAALGLPRHRALVSAARLLMTAFRVFLSFISSKF